MGKWLSIFLLALNVYQYFDPRVEEHKIMVEVLKEKKCAICPEPEPCPPKPPDIVYVESCDPCPRCWNED